MTQALNHKVRFDRFGERLLYTMFPGLAFLVALMIGVILCYFFCPRDYMFIGLVLATSTIPSLIGISVWILVHVIWWNRYQEFKIWYRGQSGAGTRALFFFAGIALFGCILLFDAIR